MQALAVYSLPLLIFVWSAFFPFCPQLTRSASDVNFLERDSHDRLLSEFILLKAASHRKVNLYVSQKVCTVNLPCSSAHHLSLFVIQLVCFVCLSAPAPPQLLSLLSPFLSVSLSLLLLFQSSTAIRKHVSQMKDPKFTKLSHFHPPNTIYPIKLKVRTLLSKQHIYHS